MRGAEAFARNFPSSFSWFLASRHSENGRSGRSRYCTGKAYVGRVLPEATVGWWDFSADYHLCREWPIVPKPAFQAAALALTVASGFGPLL